jgi:hypothetical protein
MIALLVGIALGVPLTFGGLYGFERWQHRRHLRALGRHESD